MLEEVETSGMPPRIRRDSGHDTSSPHQTPDRTSHGCPNKRGGQVRWNLPAREGPISLPLGTAVEAHVGVRTLHGGRMGRCIEAGSFLQLLVGHVNQTGWVCWNQGTLELGKACPVGGILPRANHVYLHSTLLSTRRALHHGARVAF